MNRPRPIMLKFLAIMLLRIAQKSSIMLNSMLKLFQVCQQHTNFNGYYTALLDLAFIYS